MVFWERSQAFSEIMSYFLSSWVFSGLLFTSEIMMMLVSNQVLSSRFDCCCLDIEEIDIHPMTRAGDEREGPRVQVLTHKGRANKDVWPDNSPARQPDCPKRDGGDDRVLT